MLGRMSAFLEGRIGADGRAWLDIAATPDEDLYEGRLTELRVSQAAGSLAGTGSRNPRWRA